MKKQFLKLIMVLFGLFAGVNTVWGQLDMFDGVDPEDPASWFYVNLTARVSNPNCGTNNPGTVWLVFTESQETNKKDEYNNNILLLDEHGNPVPELDKNGDPMCEGCYLYVMERKAINPWITGPKPACPYTEESGRCNNWEDSNNGFGAGVADAKNGCARSASGSSVGEGCSEHSWIQEVEEFREGYYAGYDWYSAGHYLNASNPSASNPAAWGTTASLNGYSVVYAPGFDDIMGFSAYAYFYGKAQENDGWYFTGWSYTEGDSDLGGVVGVADSLEFRVLPAANAGFDRKRSESVYATFKPVLVANYKVNSMINVAKAAGSATTTVVFDTRGERVSTADFTVSVSEANFSAAITSCIDNKVTVTVTFTNPGNLEEDVYTGNVTLASKSGCSSLTAPVYARVSDGSSNDATLYEGKTPTSSGTLEAMIAAANGTDKIVVLNRDYTAALALNATATINLNGYNIANTLTVSGGQVTLAYSKYGGRITGAVTVNAGKLILNGYDLEAAVEVKAGASLEQNGATIEGAVTNHGSLTATEGVLQAGMVSDGTFVMDGGAIEGATALAVSGSGTATLNKGSLSGTAYGIQVSGGTVTITSKLVSVYGGTNAIKHTAGSVTLNNGKFDGGTAPLAGSMTLQSGFFKVDGSHIGIAVPSGKKVLNVLAGAEYSEGYRYFIGTDASSVGVCRIGTTAYNSLADAFSYAKNNPAKDVVIIMTNDYTLPAGYYTLPSNATLIVPMSDEQETANPIISRVSNNSVNRVEYVQPYEFRRLTFAKGVNIDVHGKIELSCTQRASDDAYAAMPHGPYGHLVMAEGSHMTLQAGSELRAWGYMTGKGETDARRGATVREQFQMGDWKGGGFSFGMLGDERRVFPITQYFIQNIEAPVKYHPGAVLSTTTSVSANFGSIGMTAMANDIKVVGVTGIDDAMFLMDNEADAENTWVRKWYNAETDVQTYDVNSGAHIGSMVLDLGKLGTDPLQMNSALFVLPITNNMKIHLLSGLMDFTQSTALLPGAEVEVDKESTVTIVKSIADKATLSAWEAKKAAHDEWEADPQGDEPELPGDKPIICTGELYIFAAADWDTYACGKDISLPGNLETTKYTKVVKYSPTVGGQPNKRSETDPTKLTDASINVHGTFDTGAGTLYTTASGSNIFSSNADAGTFVITNAAPTYTSTIYMVKNGKTYSSISANSAWLKNGAGAAEPYTQTAGAESNHTFIYTNNEWYGNELLFYFDCFAAEVSMERYIAEAGKRLQGILTGQSYPYDLGSSVESIYIKPQEWLKIVGTATIDFDYNQADLMTAYAGGKLEEYWTRMAMNPRLVGVEGNADHTYSDASGEGRLFILMDQDCQWWEVEKKDNLYHCIHPQNDTYYFWDAARVIDDEPKPGWAEKRYTITWKNWDNTVLLTMGKDEYGTPVLVEEYQVTYGTQAEYFGTNPTREPDIDYEYNFTGWIPQLGPVTEDKVYTATYQKQERKYTIIFQHEGGVEIDRKFLAHNEVPKCEPEPTKVGHILKWDPAISPVIGDATYTATWLEEPPTEWDVTFVNNAGGVLQATQKVGITEHPSYSGTPAKENADHSPYTSNEYDCVFNGWSAVIDGVSRMFAVGAQLPCPTHPTVYTAVYTQEERTYRVTFLNDDDSEIEHHDYHYGETPVCSSTPSKESDDEWTYGFAWSPQIQTVMGPATYKATFPATKNKYSVTLRSNNDAVCTFTGAGIYDYGTSVTVSVILNDPSYQFDEWVEDPSLEPEFTITVTGDISLTAKVVLDGALDMELNAFQTIPIPDGMTVNIRNLVLTSDGEEASSQLLGVTEENLKVWGDAIFFIDMPFDARTWYAVAVPWTVDVRKGIHGIDMNGDEVTLPVGSAFDILALNSAANAAGDDRHSWAFVDEKDGLMHPGEAYLIYLASDMDGLLFYKKDRTPLLTTSTQVITTGVGEGGGDRANWNAVANPALYHAELATGASIGQKYIGEDNRYEPIDDDIDDGYPWIVGEPIFVQVPAPKTVVAEVAGGGGGGLLPAPARRGQKADSDITDVHFTVELTRDGKLNDRLFVATAEEKEDGYVIGQDVAKMGVSSKVAQMWIDRYDAKLCMNTIVPTSNQAEYPLAIFAPKAGEYTLGIPTLEIGGGQSVAIYLTRDGEAIANLGERNYTLLLEAGTAYNYGLRVSARSPQTATGFGEAIVDSQDATAAKVLIGNQVFIIRGEKVYSVDGQLVK